MTISQEKCILCKKKLENLAADSEGIFTGERICENCLQLLRDFKNEQATILLVAQEFVEGGAADRLYEALGEAVDKEFEEGNIQAKNSSGSHYVRDEKGRQEEKTKED